MAEHSWERPSSRGNVGICQAEYLTFPGVSHLRIPDSAGQPGSLRNLFVHTRKSRWSTRFPGPRAQCKDGAPCSKVIKNVKIVTAEHEAQPRAFLSGGLCECTGGCPRRWLYEATLPGAFRKIIFCTKKVLHVAFDVGTVV